MIWFVLAKVRHNRAVVSASTAGISTATFCVAQKLPHQRQGNKTSSSRKSSTVSFEAPANTAQFPEYTN